MKIAKRISRDTLIVVVSVIVLSALTIRVAYSAIFSVKSLSTVQEISSGTLNVIINNESSQMINIDELFPSTDLPTEEDSVVSGNYATLVLNNSGTLNSAFSVTISYDTDNLPTGNTVDDLISFDYLIIGIYDVDNDEWYQYGSSYYTQISNLTESDTNVYPVLRGNISAPAVVGNVNTRQFHVYIWLKDDTPTSEIGKLAYLKLNVKSTTINDVVNS